MKKLIITGLILLFGTNLSLYSQVGRDPNLDKYWHYRARLLKYFVAVGPNAGESLPAAERNRYGGSMNWGDTPVNLGYYIGVLATEYLLLSESYQNTDQTLTELYYAMKAIERLDIQGDKEWANYPGKPSSPPSTVNGFMIRDDVQYDFFTKHPSLNSAINCSQVGWGLDGKPGSDSQLASDWIIAHDNPANPGYIDYAKIESANDGYYAASSDNLIELEMGLALVERSIGCLYPQNTIPRGPIPFTDTYQASIGHPGVVVSNYDFYAESKNFAQNFTLYMANGNGIIPYIVGSSYNWNLLYPNGDPISQDKGGSALPFAYGLAKEGQYITGNSFMNNVDKSVFDAFANPEFRATNFSNILLPMTMAAVGDFWWQGNAEATIASQGNYPPGVDDLGRNYPGNQYGLDLFYGCLNRYLNSHSLNDTPLINNCDILNLLNSAPYEGPYSHSYISGYTRTGTPIYSYHTPWNWGGSCGRWYSNPGDQNGSSYTGNYPGLDYMLMYNLYRLAQDPVYSNTISGEFPTANSFGASTQIIGSTMNPYYPASMWYKSNPPINVAWPTSVNGLTVDNSTFINASSFGGASGYYTGDVSILGGWTGINITNTSVKRGAVFHASCQPNTICAVDGVYYQGIPTGTMNSRVASSGGYTATQEFVSQTAGLNALSNYPNPVVSQTTFVFNVENTSFCSLEIFDLQGKKVRTVFQHIPYEAGSYSLPFDLSDLGNGVYLYTLTEGGQQVTKPLVKQNN